MQRHRLLSLIAAGVGLTLTLVLGATTDGCRTFQPSPGDTGTPDPSDADRLIASECAQCHQRVVQKYEAGAHKSLTSQCLTCHENGREHMGDFLNVRARVSFSLEQCGACHTDHYSTYLHDDQSKPGHFGGSIKTSKYDEFPHYQYLMGGHGFTLEYNEDLAHAHMLKDHIDIKRKQTTTCLQCKSTAVAYYWNETSRGAVQFDKTMPWADVIARLKQESPETIDYGAGCTHCHDPHNGDFRLIRKGVISAVLQRGTDPYSKNLNVIPASIDELNQLLNARGSDGKRTADSLRLAGTLTCGQCHIEYVCGQGADRATTGEIRDDVPWRKLADIEDYYKTKFNLQQDWKHSITGQTGIKPQHPETEEYWGSVHHRLKMSCTDCHMAKATDASGRQYSSHWLTSPLKNNTARCNSCHEDVKADTLRVQDEIYARARNIEDKLNTLLQKIEAANTSGGVSADTLASAKSLYMRALTWWEWTAVSENSMGAHYPDQAREQLTTADDLASQALQLFP